MDSTISGVQSTQNLAVNIKSGVENSERGRAQRAVGSAAVGSDGRRENGAVPQVSDEYLIVEDNGLGGGLDVAEGGHLEHHAAHVVGVAPHL